MSKYDTAVRCAQIRNLVEENQYLKAMEEIETINFEKIPTISDIYLFADVFLKAEKMDIAKELYYVAYRRTASRPALYRLLMLVIQMGDIEEARELYLAYEVVAGVTLDTYELRYRLAKAAGEPRTKLIDILEHLKEDEYTEEWGFQLAQLYELEGMREQCIEECERIRRWFGTGKIVEKADRLRKKCVSPTWSKPVDDRIPEPEKPDEEELAAFAYAPVHVEEILTEDRDDKKEEMPERMEPKPEVKPEVKKQRKPMVEPKPSIQPISAVKPVPVVEPVPAVESVAAAEPVPVAEPVPEVESVSAAEPVPVVEPPVPEVEPVSAVKPVPVVEPVAAEEPVSASKSEPEPEKRVEAKEEESAEEKKKSGTRQGFLRRFVNYFKVDLDMFEDEEDEPSEEEESVSEATVVPDSRQESQHEEPDALQVEMAAAEAEGFPMESLEERLQEINEQQDMIRSLEIDIDSAVASSRHEPEMSEPDVISELEKVLPRTDTIGMEMDHVLSETEGVVPGSQAIIPPEIMASEMAMSSEMTSSSGAPVSETSVRPDSEAAVEETQVKSHPLGSSALTEDIVEDVSSNGIRYNTLKGAMYKIHREEGIINFALTGGSGGIPLAVAKRLSKELKKVKYFEAKNIGKISADRLDSVDLDEWAEKFIGGCMYITEAPSLSNKSVKSLSDLIQKYQKQIVVILEGSYDEMDSFLNYHKEFERLITYKVRL